MMPPDTASLTDSINADYERMRRNSEAYEQLGQLGWVLCRSEELDRLRAVEAAHLAALADSQRIEAEMRQIVANAQVREVMPVSAPSINSEGRPAGDDSRSAGKGNR